MERKEERKVYIEGQRQIRRNRKNEDIEERGKKKEENCEGRKINIWLILDDK
jgi:hypothetical protein